MPEIRKNLDRMTNTFVQAAGPSEILALNQEFKSIDDIVLLTVGEPDFNTPEHIKQAAIADIAANDSHYAPSNGTADLLQNAATFLKHHYQLDYDPKSEILATLGVTEAINVSIKAILNPGDEIIIPEPTFPVYALAAKAFGAKVIHVPTAADGFILTVAKLTQTLIDHPQAKAIVLTTPGNPTGVSYTEEQIQSLAQVLKQHNVFVISDEIYSELTYDRPHASFAKALPEQTILFNGVSKSHAMTGYRVGIIAGPHALISQIAVVHQLITTTLPGVTMAAAAEAFGAGENDAESMRIAYKKRRDYLIESFTKLGLSFAYPDGAFYFFVKIPAYLQQDGFKLARQIAKEAKVGVTPGVAFGQSGYLRFSYATSLEKLQIAVSRLAGFLQAEKQAK
ncbi:aminotransferase class I/II-fold pyridoxal phosphate-dependent enzyme [Oenococcus sicerae]|uniref:Aminotransferase n=1 Tax=Oenococcus sicerae TaxID=2203724 RepID=A0AAJ1RA40_9LACO|nr:aminotransferase class I/II-fold pyridoxal phosphate-dependent enzyme [Oenococcus sicerae]MDN6900295.1 aminotransferase class I/II-fold pyridoxal phosphate-dependent enzyme [Oenococcus sicerae]QAS69871.1 aminotransferase class I/II-fold pyridoxal phosphate-dependent enzyme [Oenococcus sicerae]